MRVHSFYTFGEYYFNIKQLLKQNKNGKADQRSLHHKPKTK